MEPQTVNTSGTEAAVEAESLFFGGGGTAIFFNQKRTSELERRELKEEADSCNVLHYQKKKQLSAQHVQPNAAQWRL